jgi:hypothetical protein
VLKKKVTDQSGASGKHTCRLPLLRNSESVSILYLAGLFPPGNWGMLDSTLGIEY